MASLSGCLPHAKEHGAGGPGGYAPDAMKLNGRPHLLHRPSWTCQACDDPLCDDWSCHPHARPTPPRFQRPGRARRLTAIYAEEAAHDLAGVAPADIYARFLSWSGSTSPIRRDLTPGVMPSWVGFIRLRSPWDRGI